MSTEESRIKLRNAFSGLLNYESDDPFSPIDPLAYRNPEGDTCLHIAAMRGDCDSIEMLLDAGLDINLEGDMKNTPLHYAAKSNQRDAFDLLIMRGASTSKRNDFGEVAKI